MIFPFCSVYSTCRCPFFFAKLLPGRMVKYRHANRQRTERQLSANQRFGYFINSSVCFLALSPSFRSLLMHEKSVPGKRSRKASKGGKKKNKLNIHTLNDMRTRRLSKEQGKQCNISRFPNFHKSGSIKGMKRLYYGMDALLVRCGDYIYNVSSEPNIYYQASI